MATKLEKALQMEREIVGHLLIDEPHPQIMEEWREAREYTDGLVQRLETRVSELRMAMESALAQAGEIA